MPGYGFHLPVQMSARNTHPGCYFFNVNLAGLHSLTNACPEFFHKLTVRYAFRHLPAFMHFRIFRRGCKTVRPKGLIHKALSVGDK